MTSYLVISTICFFGCLYRDVPVPITRTIWWGKFSVSKTLAYKAILPTTSVSMTSIYRNVPEKETHLVVDKMRVLVVGLGNSGRNNKRSSAVL